MADISAFSLDDPFSPVKLVKFLIKYIWAPLAIAVIVAVFMLGTTVHDAPPLYRVDVVFRITNHADADYISSSDLSASKSLVESCVKVLSTMFTMEEIAKLSGLDLDADTVHRMIDVRGLYETVLIEVGVAAENPDEALAVAKALEQVFSSRIAESFPGAAAVVVDPAYLSEVPTPPYAENTANGFIGGFAGTVFLMGAWFFLRECPPPKSE